MQDGLVEVRQDDIISNLPYHPMCGLWFDHHKSEEEAAKVAHFRGLYGIASSAARLVYQYYNDPAFDRYGEMLSETDRVDSARLAVEDVLHPERWVLLSYTLDPRSGLGAFRKYFTDLVQVAKRSQIEEILELSEVKARTQPFLSAQERFEEVTREHSYLDRSVIVTDFRELDSTPVGSRFLVFTMFPQGSIQVRIFWGRDRKNVVVAVGHSIFNRTSKVHVGKLLAEYGGGGLKGAGTCQLPVGEADQKISDIIKRIQGAA